MQNKWKELTKMSSNELKRINKQISQLINLSNIHKESEMEGGRGRNKQTVR